MRYAKAILYLVFMLVFSLAIIVWFAGTAPAATTTSSASDITVTDDYSDLCLDDFWYGTQDENDEAVPDEAFNLPLDSQ